MARINTDLTRYLPGMKASRRKLKDARIVQGTELADMIGATWRVLKARILRDSAFPVVERGANGKAWSFEAIAVLDYLIADTEQLAAQRVKNAARMARMAGVTAGPDNAPVDIAMVDDMLAAQAVDSATDLAAQSRALNALAQAQMTTHRLKQLQGEYVLADDHRRIVSVIMSTMQNETLAIASRLDPTGTLPTETRTALDNELRNVLLTVKAACERALRSAGAGAN